MRSQRQAQKASDNKPFNSRLQDRDPTATTESSTDSRVSAKSFVSILRKFGMEAFEQARDVFRDRFTRVFARLYHGPVESVDKFNGYTSEEDVYWFSGDSAMFGQATPVGTIILNKDRLENLSYEATELVYRHEQGHLERLPVFRGIFWGMVINGAVGIYYLLKSLGYSLLIPFGIPAEPVAMLAGVSLLFVFLMIVTVRLEELAADLHALREIGEQEFLDAYEEISNESSDSFGNRVLKLVLYPRLDTVVRIHRLICRIKKDEVVN